MDVRHFGSNLRSARKQRNWTQRYLAKKAGVAVTTAVLTEKGDSIPKLEIAARFSQAVGVPIEQLCSEPIQDAASLLKKGLIERINSMLLSDRFSIDAIESLAGFVSSLESQANLPPEQPVSPAKSKTTKSRKVRSLHHSEVKPFSFQVTKSNSSEVRNTCQSSQQFIQYLGPRLGSNREIEMVRIPSGLFAMGDDFNGPIHQVALKEFFMSRFPITQAQYKAVMGSKNPAPLHGALFSGEEKPVVGATWLMAVEFCDRLSAQSGLSYRLPTEAEWEYACRAGTITRWHFGDAVNPQVINCCFDEGDRDKLHPFPVDEIYEANAFGLSGMHGNVREWCLDNWSRTYECSSSGNLPYLKSGSKFRVNRGGSFFSEPTFCGSASRSYGAENKASREVGFRIVVVRDVSREAIA